jgi:hypothetical protein
MIEHGYVQTSSLEVILDTGGVTGGDQAAIGYQQNIFRA